MISVHPAAREPARPSAYFAALRAAVEFADAHPPRDHSLDGAAGRCARRIAAQRRAIVARFVAYVRGKVGQ